MATMTSAMLEDGGHQPMATRWIDHLRIFLPSCSRQPDCLWQVVTQANCVWDMRLVRVSSRSIRHDMGGERAMSIVDSCKCYLTCIPGSPLLKSS
jgi:hypothetical protein